MNAEAWKKGNRMQRNGCIWSLYLTGIQPFNNPSCDYRIKEQEKSGKANKNYREQLPKWNRVMHPKMNYAYLKMIFFWIGLTWPILKREGIIVIMLG